MEPRLPYPKAVKQFPEVRQSLLSSFDDCPLSTKFSIEHRRGWSFHYQARGEMFHRFAARALTTMAQLGEDQIPVAEALAILHEVLRQEDIDRRCPHCESTRIRKGVGKGGIRRCLDCDKSFETDLISVPTGSINELYWVVKKWAHDNAFDVQQLVDVEKQLKTTISYPNPHGGEVTRTITGRLDALMIEGMFDEKAIVLDWKDMWRLPPETEVGHGGYFQQRFYAYLIFMNYPTIESVTLREFYVRFSEPRVATVSREYDLEQIEQELVAKMLLFDRTVEEGLWIAAPGHHCSYCPMPQHCPIHPEARGAGRITSPEEAATVAAQFVVAQALVNQYRGQLGPWCERNGSVPIRDAKGKRAIGYRPVSRTIKPTPEQIDQAEREKGSPLASIEIRAMYREVPGTRLTVFVPDPVEEQAEDDNLVSQLEASLGGES